MSLKLNELERVKGGGSKARALNREGGTRARALYRVGEGVNRQTTEKITIPQLCCRTVTI